MDSLHIFDRKLVRRHRDRAAALFSPRHSVLFEEIAAQMMERLQDVKRKFPVILDLGAHNGFLARQLAASANSFVVAADLSEKMLTEKGAKPSPLGGSAKSRGLGRVGWGVGAKEIDPPPAKTKDLLKQVQVFASSPQGVRTPVLTAADEELLPFAPQSFDLIVSNLSLHWVNDLPGTLAQIWQALKPEGLFLATLFGGQTLFELRACLLDAELAVTGGVSPRLSPSIDMQTASALLQRAGFSLPVTDQEIITLSYSDIFALMRDVRGMGETNAHGQRWRKATRREVFLLADRLYKERFARADGRLPATFEVIFLHGWQ